MKLQRLHRQAHEMFERLKDSEKSIEMMGLVKNALPKSEQDSMMKKTKSLKKSIHGMYEDFTNGKDFKGYDHVTERISNLVYRGYNYYNDGLISSEQNLENVLNKLERILQEEAEKMNEFYEGDWSNFKKYVDNLEIPMVKDYESLKTE